ncbi:hypothetical protein A4D02_10105 [Niastella koreensis]|uniref:Fibronectin type-III domain-containing protein n=2 Tax=Niastella koreensis TaxID=354356 RepID=G8TPR1_NIAKG|nr:hypothetical protein [Niastella koreensis]AEV98894.1 hypothetical protein Niako_2554 [Niastella koreensis GR20-10]OQP43822.1 hypothetical protein A4D02_10105 [Niastella koreensis]
MEKRLVLNFKETKDIDLYLIASSVTYHMNENEHGCFPDPGMLIIELAETAAQFKQAMSDAHNKDRQKISVKKDLKVLLIKKLKEVGAFVKTESNGSELALLSSGFPIFTPKEEIIIKPPTDFKILPGSSAGEIIMKISRVHGAKSYLYRWTPAPATKGSLWASEIDTRCKKVIKGLPLGINYCFQMAAIGSNSQIEYTELLTRYIS